MKYIVKSGDTLSKIANKYKIPIQILISTNSEIVNPDLLMVGQVVNIYNVSDLPANATFETPVVPNDLVLRARSVVNTEIRYKLGMGGMYPKDDLPSRNGQCDCSGFICWVLGLSRETNIPFYKKFGGWIFTDSMAEDIMSDKGIFEKLQFPEPGCIVVYTNGTKIGHVGLVSAVLKNKMSKVIHCSSGNSKPANRSIQETSPAVFNRPDVMWGRFIG